MGITIPPIYEENIVEFDYIKELDWQFGLELEENSTYIPQMVQGMPKETLQRAFGGEYEKMHHYKLVVDDVGMYNVICKGIDMSYA